MDINTIKYSDVLIKKILLSLILIVLLVLGCSEESLNPIEPEDKNPPINLDPFERNQRLGRGINLGNSLEAPYEGAWGVTLKNEYFHLIQQVGFNSVRIPIRWSAHAANEPPYLIDDSFFARVDWAIEQSLKRDLAVVINIHHYEDIMQDPAGHHERFLMLWQQIAEHYKDYNRDLIFEILNEPNDNLNADLWNIYLAQAIDIIRETNPGRTIMVGTAEWGGISALSDLKIPAEEQNVIVTVHYYDPFHFTHQGAEWVEGSDDWLGMEWTGNAFEQQNVKDDLDQAEYWGQMHSRPLNIGEFGVYYKADMDSRVLWTDFFTRQAEVRNMSWTYWEFCAKFGIYDSELSQWRHELLHALIPDTQLPNHIVLRQN